MLPFRPYVELNVKEKNKPSQLLDIHGDTTEQQIGIQQLTIKLILLDFLPFYLFFFRCLLSYFDECVVFIVSAVEVLRRAGFDLVRWSRVPYLCEGDLNQPIYHLTDFILVLKHQDQ